MRRRNRHMEKISDIDFEDPSPFGEQSESNAPQAATGEIEFSALPEAQDAEGAKRRPAREDRRIVRLALDESDAVRKTLLENEDAAARLDAEKLAALQESLR